MTSSERCIYVNGEPCRLPLPLTLTELLERLDYAPDRIAVALNQTFVPRSRYGHTCLTDGDAVEIVAPMQGG